jgi:hypothetical protein
MEDKWQTIAKRISERTGLKTSEEIDAYHNFCVHSDLDDGTVMYGDVQHEFYGELHKRASQPMKVLEQAYHEAIGNNIHEDLEGNRAQVVSEEESKRLKSPLSRKAQQEFAKYYHQFLKSGLVSPPESHLENSYDASQYPKLTGYNYFNDAEFYKKTSDGNGRELVI